MKTRRAIISLGTNTVRLLVVEDEPSGLLRQLEHRAVGTRLGEGLTEGGSLGEAAMERTLEAVRTLLAPVQTQGASLTCIATSAMRRAQNAPAFEAKLADLTGVPLRVIDGAEEAAASYRGATYEDAPDAHRIAVLDIGGGSTECAVGRGRALQSSVSLELGTVRLTERFPELSGAAPGAFARNAAQRAHAAIADILSPLEAFGRVDELRAVAGTPTTIGAIATATDVDRVRGVVLTQEAVAAVRDALLDATLEQRRAIPGMLAQRADVLAAGTLILLAAMQQLRCAKFRIETNDLLLGELLPH